MLGIGDEATRARLNRLRRSGHVRSEGGRGSRLTTYELTS
jgi:hypothetical protein